MSRDFTDKDNDINETGTYYSKNGSSFTTEAQRH